MTFSPIPESMEIPIATFPLLSLSDGFVMRRNNFFSSRRSGSPSNLVINAFRQGQQQRSTGVDLEPEDGDLTDMDELLRQFEYFSSSQVMGHGDSDDSIPTSLDKPIVNE